MKRYAIGHRPSGELLRVLDTGDFQVAAGDDEPTLYDSIEDAREAIAASLRADLDVCEYGAVEEFGFHVGERIPLWGWWFRVASFGERTMRLVPLEVTSTTAKEPKLPAIGAKLKLKGRRWCVMRLDTDGCTLGVLTPTSEAVLDAVTGRNVN